MRETRTSRDVGSSADELAVSEVIGFMVIIGIVFTSIGLIYYNASPIVERAQDREHAGNSERVFDVLAANMDEIVRNDVPKRGVEMRLQDSTLAAEIDDIVVVNTSTEDPAGTWTNRTRNVVPVTYEVGEYKLRYENGAVFRQYDEGSVMIREPSWTITDEKIIMPMVLTSGGESVSDAGTIFMRLESKSGGTERYETPDSFEVEFNSTAHDAWARYFNSSAHHTVVTDVTHDPSQNKVILELDPNSDTAFMYSQDRILVNLIP